MTGTRSNGPELSLNVVITSDTGQEGMDIRLALLKVERFILCRVNITRGTFSAI